MNNIFLGKPAWTSADMVGLQGFLATEAGRRFVANLAYARPAFRPFESLEQSAVIAAKVEGYEDCIDQIANLARQSKE